MRGASATVAISVSTSSGSETTTGPGRPLRRDPEGTRHDLGNARGLVDLDGPFRHGAEHGLVIELLEGLALAHAALDLADEDDQRGGILHRDVNARRGVRGARAARDEADAGPAGEPRIGVGHHRGAALLAADEHVDRGVMQRVENREIALAGHASRAVDPLNEKLVDEDLSAGARELPRLLAAARSAASCLDLCSSYEKACIPVMARPRIRACTSWAPS